MIQVNIMRVNKWNGYFHSKFATAEKNEILYVIYRLRGPTPKRRWVLIVVGFMYSF